MSGVVFLDGCPVCGMTWTWHRGGQEVSCLRDRHIVEQHPTHALALVVVARRELGEEHPLDEACQSIPEEVEVTGPEADTADLGPFDVLDDADDYLSATETTLLVLAGEAVKMFEVEDDG